MPCTAGTYNCLHRLQQLARVVRAGVDADCLQTDLAAYGLMTSALVHHLTNSQAASLFGLFSEMVA